MKKYLFLVVIALLFAASCMARSFTINEAWSFHKGNNYESNEWTTVNIPHTWNATDATDDVDGYYRGVAWYRKNIYIEDAAKGKQVKLYFDGVNQVAQVYVNDHEVGIHKGGYTRFSFDITPYIKTGADNTIKIKVDNAYDAEIPPLKADFTFFGGIYRDVYLTIEEPIDFSSGDYASSGTYINTPQVSEKSATVIIHTLLENHLKNDKKVKVEYRVIDPSGKEVASKALSVKLKFGICNNIDASTLQIETPQLWSPTSPNRYQLITTLRDINTKEELSQQVSYFGLRWFHFDANKGFFLNGKPTKLMGTNRHQCYKDMGNALPDAIHIRDMQLLKNMGGNFLRISHYPQDPYILDMCDKLGIIAMVEIPIVNAITEDSAFLNNALCMAKEMVKQNYNHPSLVIWAYMNEVMLQPPYNKGSDSTHYNAYCKEVNRQARAIDSTFRALDSARYTLIPFHGSLQAYQDAHLVEVPRIVGWNLYSGWYGGEFSGFDDFLDSFHKLYPNTPTIVTEYGADVDVRLHSFQPQRFDYTVEYGNLFHEHYIKAILERPFVAGAALWNLNDFYSEFRGNATPHVNSKGITGLDRTPKDTYLLYQAHLLQSPFIAIGNNSWKYRAGVANKQEGVMQPLKIYSNQPQIELFNNGESLGQFNVKEGYATANVIFKEGINTLRATARVGNKTIEDSYTVHFQVIPQALKDGVFTDLNVLLGSQRYFEDKDAALCWIPEQEYKEGSWGYTGGHSFTQSTFAGNLPAFDLNIKNTAQDPIFQTQRIGIKTFKADVPAGRYAVYFYWANLTPQGKQEASVYSLGNAAIYENKGHSSITVKVDHKAVFSVSPSPQQAIIKKIYIDVTDTKGISIEFESNKGSDTYLNAIRIVKN